MIIPSRTPLAELPPRKILLWIMALTVVIEIVTVALRFGLDVRATRDTSLIGHLTFGLRIHHGYFGALLLLVALIRPKSVHVRHLALIVGVALVASDLIHHFLVLWPFTGSPELDLNYPKNPR